MTKITEIEYCGGCPFNKYSAEKYRIVCSRIVEWNRKNRQIYYNTIPSWCPLPDKKQEESNG